MPDNMKEVLKVQPEEQLEQKEKECYIIRGIRKNVRIRG